MEIKINNTAYQIKSGDETEVKELLAPYKKEKHKIKELYEVDLVQILIDGTIVEVSKIIFMKKIYPYLKDLTQETLKEFGTERWV